MDNPTVCCILLTADRPEQTARAVKAFREQTYENKQLLVWDTGRMNDWYDFKRPNETHFWETHPRYDKSVGELRNRANKHSETEILIHWDSDDVSLPTRIGNQVRHLQESGADAVGYNEMLFYRICRNCNPVGLVGNGNEVCPQCNGFHDQAWLYSDVRPWYVLGTSLCYWRKTWEQKPFPDLPKAGSTGEDTEWIKGLNVQSVSALPFYYVHADWIPEQTKRLFEPVGSGTPIPPNLHQQAPMMVAEIHGGNYNAKYYAEILGSSPQMKRVPEWDERLRSIMQL